MTVGRHRLDAYQDVQSPAVGILDGIKHINSTISDAHKGSRYCTADIKDFFLCSMMQIYQYMCIHCSYIPTEVLFEYNLTPDNFDSKDYGYLEIRKGMYGLKETAILAYEQLRNHLELYCYVPFKHTPGMWRHTTDPITFTLAVDDFGIKYFNKVDANHLFSALHAKYSITIERSGVSNLGLTINWNYNNGYLDISMPDFVPKASPASYSTTCSTCMDNFGHCKNNSILNH